MKKPKIPPHVIEDIKGSIIHGVGYRSPPKQHQFTKGQSGNPKGRPRKEKLESSHVSFPPGSNAAIISRVLSEDVTVTKNGRRHKISKAEFVQRNTEKQAAAGSVLATRDLRNQLLADDARKQLDLEANYDFWRLYLRQREKSYEDAAKTNSLPKEYWVDPEDIIFHAKAPVEIRGPVEQKEVAFFELISNFIQLRMLEWHGRILYGKNWSEKDDFDSYILFMLLTRLPKRLERDCRAYWESFAEAHILGYRWFSKERELAWQKFGKPAPKHFLDPLPVDPKQRKTIMAMIEPTVSLMRQLEKSGQRTNARRTRRNVYSPCLFV